MLETQSSYFDLGASSLDTSTDVPVRASLPQAEPRGLLILPVSYPFLFIYMKIPEHNGSFLFHDPEYL
jgi:hypothetical protein